MKNDIILWVKGVGAFLIPALTTVGGALSAGITTPTAWAGVIIAAIVAGYSGLNSFISTAFADAKTDALNINQTISTGVIPPVTPVGQQQQQNGPK